MKAKSVTWKGGQSAAELAMLTTRRPHLPELPERLQAAQVDKVGRWHDVARLDFIDRSMFAGVFGHLDVRLVARGGLGLRVGNNCCAHYVRQGDPQIGIDAVRDTQSCRGRLL
jgi:hypothetical protein